MKTWALFNQKGGSAKTTSAVSLAAALGEKGVRVLLVDLDAQGAASSWLGVREEGRAFFDLLKGTNGNLADLVRETDAPGVDLVPASPWLAGVERAASAEPGAETILRRALERLPRNKWELVLLDCPPSLGLMSVSALVAAHAVLVPVEASALALGGLASLLQTVERVRERLNPELALGGILLCRADTRTRLSAEVEESLRRRFGKLVFRSVIPETVRLREAWSYSKPLSLYAPTSPAADAYRAVAVELLKRSKEEA